MVRQPGKGHVHCVIQSSMLRLGETDKERMGRRRAFDAKQLQQRSWRDGGRKHRNPRLLRNRCILLRVPFFLFLGGPFFAPFDSCYSLWCDFLTLPARVKDKGSYFGWVLKIYMTSVAYWVSTSGHWRNCSRTQRAWVGLPCLIQRAWSFCVFGVRCE